MDVSFNLLRPLRLFHVSLMGLCAKKLNQSEMRLEEKEKFQASLFGSQIKEFEQQFTGVSHSIKKKKKKKKKNKKNKARESMVGGGKERASPKAKGNRADSTMPGALQRGWMSNIKPRRV